LTGSYLPAVFFSLHWFVGEKSEILGEASPSIFWWSNHDPRLNLIVCFLSHLFDFSELSSFASRRLSITVSLESFSVPADRKLMLSATLPKTFYRKDCVSVCSLCGFVFSSLPLDSYPLGPFFLRANIPVQLSHGVRFAEFPSDDLIRSGLVLAFFRPPPHCSPNS